MRRTYWMLVLLALKSVGAMSQQTAKPQKVVPAINEVELWQQVGQQPYEMTWTQREQDPHTLVDFEDLQGWKLELYDGAQGELRRSREQQMWGQYVCRILYWGTKPGSRVIARPPGPRFPRFDKAFPQVLNSFVQEFHKVPQTTLDTKSVGNTMVQAWYDADGRATASYDLTTAVLSAVARYAGVC